MSHPLDASQTLDREFLAIRSKLLDVAAALDRIDRAKGSVVGDPRLDKIRQSLGLLSSATADRTEAVEMIFSLPYQADWRKV
jgi:hypothetical protein